MGFAVLSPTPKLAPCLNLCDSNPITVRKADAMNTTVRATYSNGAIIPLDPLDIDEGANLSITITVEPSREKSASNAEPQCLNRTLDALYVEDYFQKARQ